MVSRETPREAAALDTLLRDMASENRQRLVEPWRARLAESAALQREMDRVVGNLQVFFSKWSVEIVIALGQHGTRRFSELKDALPGISGRTLTQRLRDLEAQRLVDRRIFDEMPIRVEYSLTKKGLDVAALALPLVLYLQVDR